MGRIKFFGPNNHISRKMGLGTWLRPGDPSVYGVLEIDVTDSLELMKEYGKKWGVRLTLSHLVARATAYSLHRRPEINAMIRFGRIYFRPSVRLFFQVNVPGKKTGEKISKAYLNGFSFDGAEAMSLKGLASHFYEAAAKVKKRKDKQNLLHMNVIKLLPQFLVRWYLRMGSFLTYGLNLNLSSLGLPQDPFGSVMITNVGSLGIDFAFAPLVPYARTPLLLAVGSVQEKPWVHEGEIKKRKIVTIGVTFDHRVIDGVHAAQLADDFKKCFAQPHDFFFTENQ